MIKYVTKMEQPGAQGAKNLRRLNMIKAAQNGKNAK